MTSTRAICLGLIGLAACGDTTSGAPGVFVTDHLVIEPSDSEVMCRGTLDDMEAQAVRVAETLGVDIPYPIHVYYGSSAVDEYCTTTEFPVSGCARGLGEDTYIAANPSSIYHELVHAVRRLNGKVGPRFFEEGIAEVLSAFWPLPYRIEVRADEAVRGPELLAALPHNEFQAYDYVLAGHFMSWLFVTYGYETVAAFLNDEGLASDASAAFASNFGLSLHDAEAAWRSSSEDLYAWGEGCDPLHELEWNGPTLEFNGRVDCNAPDTTGPINDIMKSRMRCFTLDQLGTLRVELTAASGEVELHCRIDLDPAPLSHEPANTKVVLAGEALELPFAHCAWRLSVKTDVTEPIDFSLRLTRL